MGDIVLNVALGRTAYYGSLPGTSDALILVPLEASGLVSDATMRDYATLAALLAGASNEQTTMGRRTLTGVTVTINNADNQVEVGAADATWPGATGNALGALVLCYDPDTGAGDDTSIIPISKHDFPTTPDGADVQVVIADLIRSTSAT